MTKNLEDFFNIASSGKDEEGDIILPESFTDEDATEILSSIEKIEEALPMVKGLSKTDEELDELSKLAVNSFKDLHDLGLQLDPRNMAEVLSVASSMLGHAISAQSAKINRKLRTLDLQLKKAQLDHKMSSHTKEIESTPIGEGQLLDRNEILKMLAEQKKKND